MNKKSFDVSNFARLSLSNHKFSRADLINAVDTSVVDPWDIIYQASIVRREKYSNYVRLCSIVPGKLGHCTEDCKWCAQSNPSAPGVTDFKRTTSEQIQQAAVEASKLGSAYIGVVNSGFSPSKRDLDDVKQASNEVTKDLAGKIKFCASLGDLTEKQAETLAESEVVRYHHNLETSRRFFPNMVSTHTYDQKLQTLKIAKDAGLSICCGGIFGLGENWDDRIDLAFDLRDTVGPDVVPMNFLVPVSGTKLEDQQRMNPIEILQTIALYRLILPNCDIKVAGGRESNLRSMQSMIFQAGATSIMVGNYLTTAGQTPEQDMQMLKDLELEIVSEFPK